MKTLRGVNLGGWLVLERWMTPSLFAGTEAKDEYSFMQTDDALQKMRNHEMTFITEEDFIWLSEHRIDAVRIPIGYWILDGDGPLMPSISKLDWAIRMAEQYEIKVLVCLHGAPGSQNGMDHSGRIGKARWYDEQKFRDQTIDILKRLVIRYKDKPSLWGIELLNEPTMKLYQPKLRKFYRQSYDEIVSAARTGLAVVFHDAFMPRLMSGVLWPYKNFPVYLDHHWYHFFVPQWLQPKLSLSLYYRFLRARGRMLGRLQRTQPVLIGEWSGIIGWGKLNKYPRNEHDEIIRRHYKEQCEIYKGVAGWFYWSYKTEERGVYHFRSMVEDGFFDS